MHALLCPTREPVHGRLFSKGQMFKQSVYASLKSSPVTEHTVYNQVTFNFSFLQKPTLLHELCTNRIRNK